MTAAPDVPTKGLPAPRIKKKSKRNLWFVWLLPIVAAVIGLSIAWHDWSNRGPSITITFQSAAGLEQGKTQIKFRDVVVGTVTGIRLSDSGENVLVDAQLAKDAEGLASEGSQFWVVKPTIGLSGVSGLATLLSGVYINVDSNDPRRQKAGKTSFVGLEQPPPIASDRPGTKFSLRAPTLGSLGPGAPIYFLRIAVGVVTDYKLDDNGDGVDIDVFVNAPYDKFVNGNTRFWDESGIYVNVGADGLTVSTESLVSILAGGLAFSTFGPAKDLPPNHQFKLYDTKAQASAVPIGVAIPIKMDFYQTTRGLVPGAAVSFQGVNIGTIDTTELDFDIYRRKFFTRVHATIYPALLGPVFQTLQRESPTPGEVAKSLMAFVKRGLRAELQTANLLTGSLYISLNMVEGVEPPQKLIAELPFEVPTIESGGIDQIQKQLASIVASIDRIPFDKLATELGVAVSEVTALTRTLDKSLAPELSATLRQVQKTLAEVDGILVSGSPLPAQLDSSLKEMDRAVRATRSLIDELRAKPNSIIFGESARPYSRETLGVGP